MCCMHGPLDRPPPDVVPAVSLQDDKSVETIESVLSSMTISEPKLAGSPVVYASRGLAELTGYSKEDLLGRSMFKVQCRKRPLLPCHAAKLEGTWKGRVQGRGSVLTSAGLTPCTATAIDTLRAAAEHPALLPGPVNCGADVQHVAARMPLVSRSTPAKALRGTACPGCRAPLTLH